MQNWIARSPNFFSRLTKSTTAGHRVKMRGERFKMRGERNLRGSIFTQRVIGIRNELADKVFKAGTMNIQYV